MKKEKERRKKAITTLVTDGKRTEEREGGNVLEYGKKVIRMNKRQEKTRALCGHVILSLTNIFSHILPTADEPKSPLRLSFRGSQQKHKEVEKRQSEQRKQCSIAKGTTLLSLKTVNRRQDEFQLSPVFKQHKSLCLSKSGPLHFVLFHLFIYFYHLLAEHLTG